MKLTAHTNTDFNLTTYTEPGRFGDSREWDGGVWSVAIWSTQLDGTEQVGTTVFYSDAEEARAASRAATEQHDLDNDTTNWVVLRRVR